MENNKSRQYEHIRHNVNGVPIKVSPGGVPIAVPKGVSISSMHYHDEVELLLVSGGSIIAELADGTSMEVRSGQILCINSRVVHCTYYGDSPMSSSLIQFRYRDVIKSEDKEISKYVRRYANYMGKKIYISDDNKMKSCIENICTEYKDNKEYNDLFINGYFYELLGLLSRNNFFVDANVDYDRAKLIKLRPALDYVEQNYSSDISLRDVSEVMGVSEYYFCRLFKSAFKSSFVDYLNFVRVSKADKLLSTTDMSVLEIALETGFSSLSYFNRVFKKFRGCAPTVYRIAARE